MQGALDDGGGANDTRYDETYEIGSDARHGH